MKYYVTFGQVHVHSVNGQTLDKDCVATFEAVDYETAEEYAHYLFGPKYCSLKDHEEFDEEDLNNYYHRGLIEV